MEGSRRYRRAPPNRTVLPLSCLNLGSASHPEYHGDGLLPATVDKSVQVSTPTLFAKPGFWGLRSLSSVEILLAKDLPETDAQKLQDISQQGCFLRTFTPGKCLLFGFRSLFYEGGGSTSSSSAATPEELQTITQFARGYEDELWEEARERGEVDTDTSGKGSKRHRDEELEKEIKGLEAPTKLPKPGTSMIKEGKESSKTPKPGTLPDLGKIDQEGRERKATKADDAEVPEYLWHEHVFEDCGRNWTEAQKEKLPRAAKVLQKEMLKRWKYKVLSSFLSWLKVKHKSLTALDKRYAHCLEKVDGRWRFVKPEEGDTLEEKRTKGLAGYKEWWKARATACTRDLAAGMEAIERASRALWWSWDDGSRPFHWRWPKDYQERIRDGLKVHFQHEPPQYQVPQIDTTDPHIQVKVKKKLTKVRECCYIAPGFVISLTAFFHVPKGEDDIRMVYDGSVSGLNDAMWMPRFVLPTLNTHLRSVEAGTFLADIDVGEMFLNFMLHDSV
jgi:hypothetical protein